ncbi:hypothetical protein F0562_017177 [Nyssa sinensis]|uniref:Uncharacterized protein n=1 Tax=Nyssa sinensis TaxID=561372 RepID=A0A5J4ZEQ9_9ASTE|nr:hypothetical protein F0562_017177 [Nyssa sinensis]
MMGNYGMTFAAIGGVYIGVEQLLRNKIKRSFINGAVAGSSSLGYKGKWKKEREDFIISSQSMMVREYLNDLNNYLFINFRCDGEAMELVEEV